MFWANIDTGVETYSKIVSAAQWLTDHCDAVAITGVTYCDRIWKQDKNNETYFL